MPKAEPSFAEIQTQVDAFLNRPDVQAELSFVAAQAQAAAMQVKCDAYVSRERLRRPCTI